MMGCWYGVGLLFYPFYEPLRAQIKEHGWKWMYSNGTGFLDLPPLMKIINLILSGTLPNKMIVDMVYPLLLGIGAVISGFLGFHVKYVTKAITSLEHRVILERTKATLFDRALSNGQGRTEHTDMPRFTNPFDQGWYRNLRQVLGANLLLIFLPIPIQPPPPCVPYLKESGKKQ